MKITNKYVFFWDGIYSQWYQAPMIINSVKYNCCEQYMMHQKALFFGDEEIAKSVMNAKSPRDQKELGRQIKDFDANRWGKVCLKIVIDGNHAKFSQNLDLKKEMMQTENKIFVEASPYDQIWGIGLDQDNEGIEDARNWRGQNLLGWALTLVKQELQS